MSPTRPVASATLALALLAPAAGRAELTLTQHGGRGAGQAGALVARADDPSALRYNPAGLAGLDGLRLQFGLDFQVSDVELAAPGGDAEAIHEIQFPPALYLSWKPSAEGRWAVGVGLDSPSWTLLEWPGTNELARTAIESQLTLLEGRAALAFAPAPGWSFGVAARWLRGEREQAVVRELPWIPPPAGPPSVVLRQDAESTVEGAGFELSLRWAGKGWGVGLVGASKVELDGEGEGGFEPLDAATAALPGLAAEFPGYAVRHEVELPETVVAGVWFAAGERTRIELDAELARWSGADGLRTLGADGGELPELSPAREWRDTTSIRAAFEHAYASGWRLGVGAGLQESPIEDAARGFDSPTGDTWIAALGASYDFPRVGFDLGWSWHQGEEAGSERFEEASFRASAQVFSVSARWRLDRGGAR